MSKPPVVAKLPDYRGYLEKFHVSSSHTAIRFSINFGDEHVINIQTNGPSSQSENFRYESTVPGTLTIQRVTYHDYTMPLPPDDWKMVTRVKDHEFLIEDMMSYSFESNADLRIILSKLQDQHKQNNYVWTWLDKGLGTSTDSLDKSIKKPLNANQFFRVNINDHDDGFFSVHLHHAKKEKKPAEPQKKKEKHKITEPSSDSSDKTIAKSHEHEVHLQKEVKRLKKQLKIAKGEI